MISSRAVACFPVRRTDSVSILRLIFTGFPIVLRQRRDQTRNHAGLAHAPPDRIEGDSPIGALKLRNPAVGR